VFCGIITPKEVITMGYRVNVSSDEDYSIEQAKEIIEKSINYGWKLIDIEPVENMPYKFQITIESLKEDPGRPPFEDLRI